MILAYLVQSNSLQAMAGRLRAEVSGAGHHALHRGERREAISCDGAGRQPFLDTLVETCATTRWQVHALCLIGIMLPPFR